MGWKEAFLAAEEEVERLRKALKEVLRASSTCHGCLLGGNWNNDDRALFEALYKEFYPEALK